MAINTCPHQAAKFSRIIGYAAVALVVTALAAYAGIEAAVVIIWLIGGVLLGLLALLLSRMTRRLE